MTIMAQLRRELGAFFYSPIAYVVVVAATIVNSIVFLIIVDFLSDPRTGHGAVMQMMFGGVRNEEKMEKKEWLCYSKFDCF